jgi:hypothetical protein
MSALEQISTSEIAYHVITKHLLGRKFLNLQHLLVEQCEKILQDKCLCDIYS